MKLLRKKKSEQVAQDGRIQGIAKVDRRTKDLTKRLDPGDVAVINHTDIDRVAADSLVAARPRAVLNAAKSISGRYPNLGPGILVDAGITLIDDLGPDVMTIKEGRTVTIDGASVYVGDTLIAEGKSSRTRRSPWR